VVSPIKLHIICSQGLSILTNPTDFDPEDDPRSASDASEDSEDEVDVNAGRRHYANVEKSKLRKGDVAPLGPQYSGSRVSRQAVNGDDEEEEHDPFAEHGSGESSESGFDVDDDDDDDEEEEEGGDNVGDSDPYEEEEDDEAGTDDTSVGDDEDGSDLEEDDDDDDEEDEMDEAEHQIDREQLKQMLHSDHTNVAATIAQANQADADKGRAVKTQRKTFNGILNSRIRLQQGLIATNSLTAEEVTKSATTTTTSTNNTDTTTAIHTAELAALKLWNTLESLRQSIEEARSTGTKKRKREINDDIDTTTTSSTIWARMQSAETTSLAHRRAVLQKWSTKTQAATAQPTRGKLTNNSTTSGSSTILDVLTSHLSNPDPLIARTRIPRSCAPLQASASTKSQNPSTTSPPNNNTTNIYDDADFYGLLLKSLLEQHSIDSATNVNTNASTLARQHMAAARDAKTKKNVDVKASKGRKLKYTVHEELQNYMAPEDRGLWTGRQVDEFFGSLLGRRVEIGEEGDGEVGEEEALMLFRS